MDQVIAAVLAGMLIFVIGLMSWLLVSRLAVKRRISLPIKVFLAIIVFNIIWFAATWIYAACILEHLTKVAGWNDELYVAILTIHSWGYYISSGLLAVTLIWYAIARYTRNVKRP